MLIYRGKMNWYNYAKNEGFTVILPLGTSQLDDPIHLYWQWTEVDSGVTKLNVLARTTITSAIQPAVEGEVGFSCVHDDYYTFDITSKRNREQLSLYMRNPMGDTSAEMVLQRFRVLPDNAFPMSPERPIPRIYAGKLDWFNYAVDELFLVVLPDGLGRSYPATAHWQWTEIDNGDTNVNCDASDRQDYSESDDQDANSFYFTQGDYYTLECTADDTAEELTVTLKNPAGDSVSTTLQLQDIINDSGDADGMRRKRAVLNHSATIFNDTSDLVIYTFVPSASDVGGKVLAVGGLITTFAPLLLPKLFTPHGWAITTVGAGTALLGGIEPFLVPQDPNTRPLFPGDAAYNRSSGGLFISYNNVVLIRVYIETVDDGATQLVIRNGAAKDIGDVSWSLADDASNELTWSDYFRITLSSPHHIKTFRAINIKCLRPSWPGSEVSIDDSDSPDMDQYTLFLGAKSSEILRYSTQVEGEEYGDVLFTCAPPDYMFVVTQGFGPDKPVSNSVGDYHIAPLQNGTILVQIEDAKIRTLSGDPRGVKVKTCTTEVEVHDEIAANPGFFAYEWTEAQELLCWPQSLDIQVVRERTIWSCIYFAVPGINVITEQFMLKDEP